MAGKSKVYKELRLLAKNKFRSKSLTLALIFIITTLLNPFIMQTNFVSASEVNNLYVDNVVSEDIVSTENITSELEKVESDNVDNVEDISIDNTQVIEDKQEIIDETVNNIEDKTQENEEEIFEDETQVSEEGVVEEETEKNEEEIIEDKLTIDKEIMVDKEVENQEEEIVPEKEYTTFTIEDIVNQALDITPNTLDFPITIRDFKGDHILFQPNSSHVPWLGSGMVEATIGSNKKPVFKQDTIKTLSEALWRNKDKIINAVNYSKSYNKNEIKDRLNNIKYIGSLNNLAEWYDTVKNKEYDEIKNQINTAYRYIYYNMNKFFEDTSATNSSSLNKQDDGIIKKITLNKVNGSDQYSFDSSADEPYKSLGGFFAANGKGFGNEGYTDSKNKSHNFHFTLESHSRFWIPKKGEIPKDGLIFEFTGDDDVWVYVNNTLVIDLGGIHGKQQAKFTITQDGDNIKITGNNGNRVTLENSNGRWVDFDFFYMERNTTESNLKIQTNIKFVPNMTVEKQAFLIDNAGNEVILNNNDYVYPGETVYYKFIIRNKGNVDLTNISFEDDTLNLKINKDGVFKKNTGEPIGFEDLTIIKNGKEITENKLNALSSLHLAEGEDTTIEIKSKDFLKYVIKESDTQKEVITNRVIAKANYIIKENNTSGPLEDSAEASITVIPKPIEENIVKLEVLITKTINKIVRNGVQIYPNSDNKLPNLLPDDIVTFKFDIVNKSTSRRLVDNIVQWEGPIGVEGLALTDDLTIGNNYKKSNFEFYTIVNNNNNPFYNSGNFNLEKSELLTLYSDWTITVDEANHYRYKLDKDVTNTIKLFKNGGLPEEDSKKLGESSVKLKIQPPSLKIKKVISSGSLVDDNNERTFTINIKGSNNKEYCIEAKPGTEYTLENLKYGVKYTVSEIVPMNYKLVSIKFDATNENNITLTGDNIGATATIINKKINDSFWFHDSKVTNIFEYDPNGTKN